MSNSTLSTSARRLLAGLIPSLLGQGSFTPGRPDASRALAGLGDSLCRWLEQHPRILLCGGNPLEPLSCFALGLSDASVAPAEYLTDGDQETVRLHLAGFWKDRRLALLCLRKGLTTAEFDHLYHLLSNYAGQGLKLRSRVFEEQARGHLAHVSVVFWDDLPETENTVPWPAKVTLGWLYRDLNLLSRVQNLAIREKVDWREQLLASAIDLPRQCGFLSDFFANLDLIAEEIDNYDKDELVFALLEHLDDEYVDGLCLQLCEKLGRLEPKEGQPGAARDRRHAATKWITRRLAEHMMTEGLAAPQHYHALVLHKVLLYEEIPQRMRPRVASLQVLTSFLNNPQKYFHEVENSHSPEVLETRLWRILDMVPRLIQALRFDVARQVLEFSHRFGATFELHNKPDIMQAMMTSAAGVLLETTREQQAALMKELPQMGRTGQRLLIDLADHQNRSVRRTAIDALIKTGQSIVPFLFEILEQKQGWHYLRNMLLILAQLDAGGPKVEKLLRQCCAHQEANVRKEALPGLAKLLRSGAAVPVADALDDPDMEVRKRAAACLGLTGISDARVYQRLAEILSAKDCSEELAIQIVASINRLKPQPLGTPELETALLGLLGKGGFLGLGGRKSSHSETLRISVAQALGFVGTPRSVKVLKKALSEQQVSLSKVVKESLQRIDARNG